MQYRLISISTAIVYMLATGLHAQSTQPATKPARMLVPGDRISVGIHDLVAPGHVEDQHVRIDKDGNVPLLLIGKIKAAGMTTDQLERHVSDAYGAAKIIAKADVRVQLQESAATQPSEP